MTPRDDERSSAPGRDPEQPHPGAQADALAATVIAYLLTGPAIFGAIGWGIDRLLDVRGFVVGGLLVGMGLSIYLIWFRYGRP